MTPQASITNSFVDDPDVTNCRSAYDFLSKISQPDIQLLKQHTAYHEFCQSLLNLKSLYSQINGDQSNQDSLEMESTYTEDVSFLSTAADEIWFNILEYSDAFTTSQVAMTNNHCYELALKSAKRRTEFFVQQRQLVSPWALLRAQEQLIGFGSDGDHHVPIPNILLDRRIVLTGAGDEEYNGIYYCTRCNGNGFVFTKPRAEQPIINYTRSFSTSESSELDSDDSINDNVDTRSMQEVDEDLCLLRCIIAKRYSNETLFWYCSKEVVDEDGQVQQVFAYWAKLMWIGDASPDICQYPSQSSLLARRDESWQALSTVSDLQAPEVELLD